MEVGVEQEHNIVIFYLLWLTFIIISLFDYIVFTGIWSKSKCANNGQLREIWIKDF